MPAAITDKDLNPRVSRQWHSMIWRALSGRPYCQSKSEPLLDGAVRTAGYQGCGEDADDLARLYPFAIRFWRSVV